MVARPNPLLREPLVAFLVLGVVVAALVLAARSARSTRERIEIPAETIRGVVERRVEVLGRPLTDDEQRELVEGLVDDEVLLREARRRGLDRDDFRVRRRLLTVMRATLDVPVPEPTEDDLRAYYDAHADDLRTPPAWTFEQVFFAWGSDARPDDPARFLDALETAEDPLALGEPTLGGGLRLRASRSDLVLEFGPTLADALSAAPLDAWRGPVESRAGVHYVRVLERHPAALESFESIVGYVREEWRFTRRLELQRRAIDALRRDYEIVLPGDDGSDAP